MDLGGEGKWVRETRGGKKRGKRERLQSQDAKYERRTKEKIPCVVSAVILIVHFEICLLSKIGSRCLNDNLSFLAF